MSATFSTRYVITSSSSNVARRYGMTSLSNSHFISNGTPGSAMTAPLGSSTMKDGAVPFGFSTGIAPSGMYACRELFAVMMSPRR